MERTIGLDVAKILAMFMVFVIHNLGQGGVLQSVERTTPSFYLLWYLENIGIVGVNVFALISGYISVVKKINYYRVFYVMVQATFWATLIMIGLCALGQSYSLKTILSNVLPIISGRYWYINSYIGMMLLAPFLNHGLQELSRNSLSKLVMILLIMACSIGFIGNFTLLGGYSVIWLVIMYIVGGYFRLYNPMKNYKNFGVYFFVCPIISLLLEFLSKFLNIQIHIFTDYTSPIVFCQSLLLFELMRRIKVNMKYSEMIKKVSSLTLGAYLINCSELYNFLGGKLVWVLDYNFIIQFLLVLILSIAMYIIALIMENMRVLLFRVTKTDEAINQVYSVVVRKFNCLTNILIKEK